MSVVLLLLLVLPEAAPYTTTSAGLVRSAGCELWCRSLGVGWLVGWLVGCSEHKYVTKFVSAQCGERGACCRCVLRYAPHTLGGAVGQRSCTQQEELDDSASGMKVPEWYAYTCTGHACVWEEGWAGLRQTHSK